MKPALDVRDLREKLGEPRQGGLTKPIKARDAPKKTQKDLETPFRLLWESLYPDVKLVEQYRFNMSRRWKFDFAHAASQVAIEIEGIFYDDSGKSRHQTGTGYEADCCKYNDAIYEGWVVFRLTARLARDTDQLMQIASTIEQRTDPRLAELWRKKKRGKTP